MLKSMVGVEALVIVDADTTEVDINTVVSALVLR
jgi:hypothetical protein